MNLKLKSVSGKGDLQQERLIINVLKDTNIADYVVLRTGYGTNGSPTTKVLNTLWLASHKLAENDLVVVYSKVGTKHTRELESGRTAHFFYWGSATELWAEGTKSVAVLLHAPEWQSKTIEDL